MLLQCLHSRHTATWPILLIPSGDACRACQLYRQAEVHGRWSCWHEALTNTSTGMSYPALDRMILQNLLWHARKCVSIQLVTAVRRTLLHNSDVKALWLTLTNYGRLCRALAEEDVQGSSSSVREAAGAEGNAVMPQGALKESGLSSTDAYLTRKAGMYCDVVERLARNHLEVSTPLG